MSRPWTVARWTLAAIVAASTGAAAQAARQLAPLIEETVVPLANGAPITLPGCWTIRTTMWEDAALVFYDRYAWWSLDGGAKQPRRVHEYPRAVGMPNTGPVWSRDGHSLFVWLELERQLTKVDVATGAMRSIADLPAHVWSYEGLRHLDPAPVHRSGGVVEDPSSGRLLQLLQEESNEQVAFWQRSAARQGGYSLVEFDPAAGAMMSMFGGGQLAGKAIQWDFSLARQRLFVLNPSRTIVERDPGGHLVRVLPVPEGMASAIVLSPDSRTLLIERLYKPGVVPPGVEPDGSVSVMKLLLTPTVGAALPQLGGGFVLLDLDNLSVRGGPEEGRLCAWSPNGRSIAYLAPWELRTWDVGRGAPETIAHRHSGAGQRADPMYYEQPAWSADGRRLCVGIGGDEDGQPTLLLDLAAHEALVLDAYAQHMIWSSVPRPFPDGFKDSSGS